MSHRIEDAAASKSVFGNHSSGNLNAHIGSGPQNNNNGDGSQYNAAAIYINKKNYSERPETPPQPSATIPFSRDPNFVDRGDILERINTILSKPAARVALVGLGGIGKSQLAIEFAHRITIGQPNTWVFWVHAGTRARVEEDFMAIADAIKLRGRNQPKANIPQLVYGWLSNERNSKWIMILDSADDRDVFYATNSGSKEKPLASYLPQSRNGAILVTTRNKELAHWLTGSHNILNVGPMALADALTLLEKKLGSQTDNNTAQDLVKALDLMPLAISQAAAYIEKESPITSVEKYLAEFRKSKQKRTWLLGHDVGELRRDVSAPNSILITWQISFNYIRSRRESAADLLSLMSFFDRQGIPKSLLQSVEAGGILRVDRLDLSDDSESESSSKGDEPDSSFQDDIAMLRDFCLVATNNSGSVFEMHALVQLSMQEWLKSDGRQDKFKQQFIKRIAAAFPAGDYSNWAICRQLFAHVESATDQRPVEESIEEWASLMHNGGHYAWSQGRYEVAERMAGKAQRSRKKKFGESDKRTLVSMLLLALVFLDKGLWVKAEKLFVQAMETSSSALGEEHPHTLTSMGNLASTYKNQGRWKEAESLEVQVMETFKRVLGEEHPDTLTSMANLASTYGNQGRWKEAESLEVQVMETRKRVLGEEHPDTLTSMNNLAYTWKGQGRLAEALDLMKDCAQVQQRVLGPEHPRTLSTLAAVPAWSS